MPDRVPTDADLDDPLDHPLLDPARLREVRAVMSRHVGVVRDALSLSSAAGALGAIGHGLAAVNRVGESATDDSDSSTTSPVEPSRRSWEATNILTVATAMVAAASTRTESRGCHRRSDHPTSRPEWVRHLDVALDAIGSLSVKERS